MEELFNNVLVLVPVALLIFLRVFSESARKRSAKDSKTTMGTGGTTLTAPPRKPQERPWSTTPKAPSKQKAKPSAGQPKPAGRDLLGRLGAYLSGDTDLPTQQREPLHFEEEAARRLGQFQTQAAGSAGAKAQMASGYKEGLPGAMDESPAITREPVTRYSLPERLDRLPPLKRAIVLSEVLGKPKSMQ